jgi:hypothetical protein
MNISLHSQSVLLRIYFAFTAGVCCPYGKKKINLALASNRNSIIEPVWIIKNELLYEWEVSPKHPHSWLLSHYIVSHIAFIIGTHVVEGCRYFGHSGRQNSICLGSCIGSCIWFREVQYYARITLNSSCTDIRYLRSQFMKENIKYLRVVTVF